MWPVLEPLLGPVLLLLGVAASALLVLGAVRGLWPRPWPVRALLVTVHAALVLMVMVGWVNGLPGFFEENTRMVHLMAGFNELRHGAPDPREQGVDLILVDQVKSKVVLAPSGAGYANSGIPITDRQQLTDLFELLSKHRDRIGLVVCDILFEGSTPNDSALAAAMLPLVEDRKLVMAHGDTVNTPLLHFPEAMASVLAGTQAGKVVRQELVTPQGRPTLPYLMHARYKDLELQHSRWGFFLLETDAEGTHRTYPYVIPFLDRLSESSFVPNQRAVGGTSVPLPPLMPIELRYVARAGEALLLPRIQESPAERGPIIFIGEFLGSPALGGTDRHQTFRGEKQGSTILLNQFLELEADAHRFAATPLVLQFVMLLLISWLIFGHFGRPAWMQGGLLKGYYAEPTKPTRPADLFQAAHHAAWSFVKANIPAILIALSFGLVGWCHRQPANIGALLLYLVLLDRFARHAQITTHEASEPPPAAAGAAVPAAERP